MPERIELRRTKGWRLPESAVSVARPTRWGNPIRVTPEWVGRYSMDVTPGDEIRKGQQIGRVQRRRMHRLVGSPMDRNGGPAYNDLDTARYFAAQNFKWDLLNDRFADAYPSIEDIERELAGLDLACWCPLRYHRNGTYRWGECHADVLLELANRRQL